MTAVDVQGQPAEFGHLAAGRPRRLLKRLFDITFSVLTVVVGLPLFVLVAMAVATTSRGPILFAHDRVGRGGKPFRCLKFRTMVCDAEERLAELLARDPKAATEFAEHHKLKDDPRITRVGRFLRATSLDELPQFLNVLAGHMSVVGPRPIVEEELDRYGDNAEAYLSIRPGLTGPWQVSGRNDVTYEDRVRLDVDYARRLSLRQDVRIVLRTVRVMLGRIGAY